MFFFLRSVPCLHKANPLRGSSIFTTDHSPLPPPPKKPEIYTLKNKRLHPKMNVYVLHIVFSSNALCTNPQTIFFAPGSKICMRAPGSEGLRGRRERLAGWRAMRYIGTTKLSQRSVFLFLYFCLLPLVGTCPKGACNVVTRRLDTSDLALSPTQQARR
jgi:hypothetical protein